MNNKYTCVCGSIINHNYKNKHIFTHKHINFIKNDNNANNIIYIIEDKHKIKINNIHNNGDNDDTIIWFENDKQFVLNIDNLINTYKLKKLNLL